MTAGYGEVNTRQPGPDWVSGNHTLPEQLERGDFDVAMSGIAVLGPRLRKLRFTDSYLQTTGALLVRDHRRGEFAKRMESKDFKRLRIGVARSDDGSKLIRAYLPGVEIVQIASIRQYFESEGAQVDALAWVAETGSAWTLLYPQFSVVPRQPVTHIPMAYALAPRETEFEEYLSRLLEITNGTNFDERLYDHWILGKTRDPKAPRWSVLRNVLGWVE